MSNRVIRVGGSTLIIVATATVAIWCFALAAIRAAEISTELKLLREAVASLQGQGGFRAAADASDRSRDATAVAVTTLDDVTGTSIGKADAPVTIVEFTDLQCPFCSKFTSTTFQELKQRFIDTGTVRFVTKDYPLPFHELAKGAAIASRCAGEQGKFWEFRHEIVKSTSNLSQQSIDDVAKRLGLESALFAKCLVNPMHLVAVENDYADGTRAGVSGTPTFVIGRTATKGLSGQRIVGMQELQAFETQIRALLNP